MDIKDVKVGGIYYLPIKVKSVASEDIDINDICITDENGDQWNEYDAAEMVTSADIVKAINEKMDDQVDFWKRDSESAHEENRKLQERIKRLEDSNAQYVEQIQKYETGLRSAKNDIDSKQMTIIQTTKRCADLQRQLADFKSAKEKDEAMLTDLNKSLNDRIAKLEAEKARPVCTVAEDPKVEALRKALKGQGNDIRRKRAIINALAERVVYLEGEMKKNG